MKHALKVLRANLNLRNDQMPEHPDPDADAVLKQKIADIDQAISLIEAHLKFRECGPMPGDSNAALWDLEHSLSIHRDMAKAHEGHPKGEYHLKCIREIEIAIDVLKAHMERLEQTPPEKLIGLRGVIPPQEPHKTYGLSFSEALEAVKQGKAVNRTVAGPGESRHLILHGYYCPSVADMIATDWQIVG